MRYSSSPPHPRAGHQHTPHLPTNHTTPNGGRLRRHVKYWKSFTDNQWALQTVGQGLRVPFTSQPFQKRLPPETLAGTDAGTVHAAVLEFQTQRVLEPAPRLPNRRVLYRHSHFTVPKREPGKFRHIINMRRGNAFVAHTHFKMEGLETLKRLVHPGDWCTKVDIASAFTHVPIFPGHRDFFRIRHRGKELRFAAMPFGYRDSPRVFTMLMRTALKPLRERGLRLVAYIDDILLLASSREEALQQTEMLLWHLHFLGFNIAWEKCVLQPTKALDFLGQRLDTEAMSLQIPLDRVNGLRKEVRAFLRLAKEEGRTAKHLARLIGRLGACTPAMEPGPIMTRALLHDLNRARRHGGWTQPVTLSDQAEADLQWWISHLALWPGKSLLAAVPTLVVTTDASRTGWGAWISTVEDQETPLSSTWGFWPGAVARTKSSNWREAQATLLALQAFRGLVRNNTLLLRSDNASNVANLNRGGSSSQPLTDIVRAVWRLSLTLRAPFKAAFYAGRENTWADTLSRIARDNSDWQLHPRLWQKVDSLWGPHSIDLFATSNNCQLPRFFAYRPSPGAAAIDAFIQDWRKERNLYGNPPFAQIGRVLQKVIAERVTMTIIVPVWRTAPWWPVLLGVLADVPRVLPSLDDTFRPGHLGNDEGMGRPRWQAIACRVSGDVHVSTAFRLKLLQLCNTHAARVHPRRSVILGDASSVFVDINDSTLWQYL